MPHYWFRVPLDSTAPHLKRAKERGGPPAVTRALKADAHSRGKSIAAAEYPPDAQFCDTAVYSDEPMSPDECGWFHSRWETGDEGCPEPWYSADEVVIDASSGWRLGGDATEAT